eukprot:768222-Amphidinium_carterae.1
MPFQVLDNDPRMHITNANTYQMRIPLHAAKLQGSRKQSISTTSTLLLFVMKLRQNLFMNLRCNPVVVLKRCDDDGNPLTFNQRGRKRLPKK